MSAVFTYTPFMADAERAGGCSNPVKLDGLPGQWWVMDRPEIQLTRSGGYLRSLRVVPHDDAAHRFVGVFWMPLPGPPERQP